MKKSVLNSALKQVGRELCIDSKTVEEIYRSYWRFVHDTISDLPLKKETSETTDLPIVNFNIPYIGKLYTNKGIIEKYRKQLKYYQDVRDKKNKANRMPSTGD